MTLLYNPPRNIMINLNEMLREKTTAERLHDFLMAETTGRIDLHTFMELSRNHTNQLLLDTPTKINEVSSIPGIINYGLIYDDTPQGMDFWHSLSKKWRRLNA